MKRDFRTRLTALLISIVFLPFNVYGLDAKAFIANEYADSSIADEYVDFYVEDEYIDSSADMSTDKKQECQYTGFG